MYLGTELTGLVDGLDMRGEGRKKLGCFWLEQLCGSWCYLPRMEKLEGVGGVQIAIKLKQWKDSKSTQSSDMLDLRYL